MSLTSDIYSKLHLFDDKVGIVSIVSSEKFDNISEDIKSDIRTIFSFLDDNSSESEITWAKELLEEIANYEQNPPIFQVYPGENFSIEIEVDSGKDFSGFNLTLRKADDLTALSPLDIQGDSDTNSPTQQIYVNDLNLDPQTFIKALALLEEPDGNGKATGESVSLLTEVWLIIEDKIDSNE